jgi:hypothetical protein
MSRERENKSERGREGGRSQRNNVIAGRFQGEKYKGKGGEFFVKENISLFFLDSCMPALTYLLTQV